MRKEKERGVRIPSWVPQEFRGRFRHLVNAQVQYRTTHSMGMPGIDAFGDYFRDLEALAWDMMRLLPDEARILGHIVSTVSEPISERIKKGTFDRRTFGQRLNDFRNMRSLHGKMLSAELMVESHPRQSANFFRKQGRPDWIDERMEKENLTPDKFLTKKELNRRNPVGVYRRRLMGVSHKTKKN